MQDAIKHILRQLGEDPDREGLLDTPRRVEKSLAVPDQRLRTPTSTR